MRHIGIDIGGTFTDCNVVDDSGLRSFKSSSTPPNFAQGVLDVLQLAADGYGEQLAEFLQSAGFFSHGMTVATNTVITRSGVPVSLITTRGAGDTYEMGRSFRGGVIDLATVHHPLPLVTRRDVEEVTERCDYKGREIAPLNVDEAVAAIDRGLAKGIRSFAVCFLWSFLDPSHERRVEELIRERCPDAYISVSSDLTGLLGEYERTSTSVINSYVGPAVADYLGALGTGLRAAGLDRDPMIMRSDGGVTTLHGAERAPVNLLFSGPAAGLVGAKYLSGRIDEPNLVTFDMGGTSTDVALVQDGEIQTATSKEIDRLPVAVPLIDIHSVAAGGGSIASVGMGGTLQVGPASAGAAPGPCAYARGGVEPTVTDADVALGYITPDYFAGGRFDLRADLAAAAIDRLGGQLGLSRGETAAGIVEVVNHVMADAIRVRTVERGADPRDFTMLSFGGAGGLHCTDVARMLGIRRIVVPRQASTFSALGLIASDLIDTTTVTRHLEVPATVGDVDDEVLRQLNDMFSDLEAQGKKALASQGVQEDGIEIRHLVQMCYRGQVLDLEVPVGRTPVTANVLESVVADFNERYLRTYGPASAVSGAGYLLRNYKTVASAARPKPELFAVEATGGSFAATGARQAYSPVARGFVEMQVFRGPLPVGAEVMGPAVIEFPDTAIVIFEGDRCIIDELGNAIVDVAAAAETVGDEGAGGAHRSTGAVDPVLLEVTRSYELSVNQEMSKTIINLSGSPLFVGASDYACACVTAEGELLNALSFQMPMAYTVSNTVKAALRTYGDDLADGDMIFSNDSFIAGGLHPSDCVIVTPVFHEGELVMWVGTVGHVTDVGGANFGSFPVGHIECFGEAVRFTPIKFYEKGRFRVDILATFLTNVRIPERTEADLRAMMGANWVARDRMREFIAKHGVETVRSIHGAMLNIGEDALRERLRLLPDGEYTGESYMEHDGVDDRLYVFRCTLRKDQDRLTVDFTGSSPQAPGALNCVEVGTRGAVVAALAASLVPDVPFTEGLFRPVEVLAPEGTVMNAVKPAPISAGSTSGTRFGADALIEALNYALADHPKTQHRRNGPWSTWTFTMFNGKNQHGAPWIFTEFWGGFGGASGLPFRDGHPAMGGLQYTDSRLPNIEEFEMLNPALIVSRGFVRNAGGAGKFRGGAGLCGVLIPHDTDGLRMTSIHNRRTSPGFGVSGGHPGGGSLIGYLRGRAPQMLSEWSNGTFPDIDIHTRDMELPATRVSGPWLAPEDAYYCRSTSGQGYGDPLDRDPELVRDDVDGGWTTVDRARELYGVAIDDATGRVDHGETESLRAAIRAERGALPTAGEAGARG